MRIMAIDYGDARTGVAVSDSSATLVAEAWVVHSKNVKETALAIIDEAIRRSVGCIVVGYPKNMNGTIGPRAEKSERFAEMLRSGHDIEVTLRDERMTTISAHRILTDVGKYGKKRKKTIDAVAASLILEDYLAFKKGQ
jgi:putative Holliday junction resolvase